MNKLLIVILAVCLVSVNSALVKRETANATPNFLDDIPKKLEDLSKSLKDQVNKAFNPEDIKKTFSEGIDNINKFIQDVQKQGEAKQ